MTDEEICASCSYTQGRQSWCEGMYCEKLKRSKK